MIEKDNTINELNTTVNSLVEKFKTNNRELHKKNNQLTDHRNKLIDKVNILEEKLSPTPNPIQVMDFEPADNGGPSVSNASVEEAQSNYSTAVKQYGANSPQAEQAAIQLSAAQKAVEEQKANAEKQRYEDSINKARKVKL